MTSTFETGTPQNLAGINALASREPGYGVARKCLEVQSAAEAVDPTLHTDDEVRLCADAWSWYVGALGEIEVGGILAQLGSDWMVRHSVPIGDKMTDVDHLLVGPNGVFALNSKRHVDASVWVADDVLRVNANNTFELRASKSEAHNVTARLSDRVGFPVVVRSAIVLVGERSVKDIREPQPAMPAVVSSRNLISWLLAQPTTATPAELGLIRLAAEEPGTWHVDATAADTLRVMSRFERLRAEVGENPPSPFAEERARARVVAPRSRASTSASRSPRSPRSRTSTRSTSSRRAPARRKTSKGEDALARLIGAGLMIGGAIWFLNMLTGH